MTKAQHTPGPWFQKEARTMTHIHSENGTMIGSLSIGCDRSKGETFAKEGSERSANARLIAAAPELLSAAERVLGEIEGDYIDDVWGRDLQYLKTAIAKAKG